MQLRQEWSLHLSFYSYIETKLFGWPTSGNEHNCAAKRKRSSYPIGLMSALTLCGKFSNSLRNWEAVIPNDNLTAVAAQAYLFLVRSSVELKQTKQNKLYRVFRPGSGKPACVLKRCESHQHLSLLVVRYWFSWGLQTTFICKWNIKLSPNFGNTLCTLRFCGPRGLSLQFLTKITDRELDDQYEGGYIFNMYYDFTSKKKTAFSSKWCHLQKMRSGDFLSRAVWGQNVRLKTNSSTSDHKEQKLMGQVPRLRKKIFEKKMSVEKWPESDQQGLFLQLQEANSRSGWVVNQGRQTPLSPTDRLPAGLWRLPHVLSTGTLREKRPNQPRSISTRAAAGA